MGGRPLGRSAGIVLTFLTLLLPTAPILAQPPASPWIGKRVVPKARGFTLRLPAGPVERSKPYVGLYRVENVDGSRLWLVAPGLSGWADASEVVPVESAIEHFTNLIAAKPNEPFAYTRRALIWREVKGELDLALSDYNQAIRIDPTEAYVYNNRGVVWEARRDDDKALADYNEAIRLDPKEASIYNNRGVVWRAKKDDEKALADFSEAIRLDPKYAKAYYNRGNVSRVMQEHDKAVADFVEAFRLDPKYVYAYNLAAWTWATCPNPKVRDGKQAVEAATKACELTAWKEAISLGILAAASAEAGDFASAVDWQTKANAFLHDESSLTRGKELLKLYEAKMPYREP